MAAKRASQHESGRADGNSALASAWRFLGHGVFLHKGTKSFIGFWLTPITAISCDDLDLPSLDGRQVQLFGNSQSDRIFELLVGQIKLTVKVEMAPPSH